MTILIRTALFVPGNRPDRIEKAFNTGADVVIMDLEDAVPLSEKESSRSKVREKVAQFADRMILVRINGLGSPFIKGDLEEAIVEGVNGIVFPKVEKADDIREINSLLLEVEKIRALPEGSIQVFPLIESAAAIQQIYDIVSTKTKPKRIYTVAFGAADYTLDMGIEMTIEGNELFYARSKISIACRAAGIAPPVDTPFMIDLKNTEALINDARRAKELGFQGKLVIHPNQVEPCNRIFSPTAEEIAKAIKIVQAFEEAEAAGMAAIQLEGKFIDYPVVKRSKDILALATAIGKKG
ncbi:MAG: CoA ester lyase [Desulfobacteraceae bacterium]|nr:MAG: CoA ester lyase [Desulfobacteraceae bacterium]